MIEVKIKVEFPLGSIVHLKCEDPHIQRVLTGYQVNLHGVRYVTSPSIENGSLHFASELAFTEDAPRQFGFIPYYKGEENIT